MIEMLKAAKAAKPEIARLSESKKNAALNAMADALIANTQQILTANAADMEKAKGTVSTVMLDRSWLTELLTSARIWLAVCVMWLSVPFTLST